MDPQLLRQYLTYFQDLGIKDVYWQPEARVEAAALPVVAEVPQAARPEPLPVLVETLITIREELGDCRRCPLCESRTQIIYGEGNAGADLVFVGEGPGIDEDAAGSPYAGNAGLLLTQIIDNTSMKEGFALRRPDVYFTTTVKCRRPEDRTPHEAELSACTPFLFQQLRAIKPKVIVAMGATAARVLVQSRKPMNELRGNWFEWEGTPVMVTYAPSYLLHNEGQKAKREVWLDIKAVLYRIHGKEQPF